MPETDDAILDCLVIGGGPAGLTAATYLARYRRKVVVVVDGKSRAALIPESHNYPGFAQGIAGDALLARLRTQAGEYGAHLYDGRIAELAHTPGGFSARANGRQFRARHVLLATGIVDESPDLPNLDEVVERGTLRYCPICDGFEAIDRRIGVLGRTSRAAPKAIFLRTYSRDVVLLPTDDPQPHDAIRQELAAAGVAVPDGRVVTVARDGKAIAFRDANGETGRVDVLYPALGCHVRSELARALDAACDDIGLLVVDDKQKTSIDGLYAAGDVVSDLHQISVATGHAAVAATAIHNGLDPNWR